MSAVVAIEWLKGAIADGSHLTAEDMDAARGVAASCDPADAAVIRSLLHVVIMEALPTWPPMPAPRTPAEQRMVDAVLRVAAAPDPHPDRSDPVRDVLTEAWDALEGGPRLDRVKTARVMRGASVADRGLFASLTRTRL